MLMFGALGHCNWLQGHIHCNISLKKCLTVLDTSGDKDESLNWHSDEHFDMRSCLMCLNFYLNNTATC